MAHTFQHGLAWLGGRALDGTVGAYNLILPGTLDVDLVKRGARRIGNLVGLDDLSYDPVRFREERAAAEAAALQHQTDAYVDSRADGRIDKRVQPWALDPTVPSLAPKPETPAESDAAPATTPGRPTLAGVRLEWVAVAVALVIVLGIALWRK